MTISKIKDVEIVFNAIRQTTQINLRLRIDGAHVKLQPDNTFSEWTFYRAISRAHMNDDGRISKIPSITETKQFWLMDAKDPLTIWRKRANAHPNKRHMYNKLHDYYRASNQAWRAMEQPHSWRGLDLDHPELW